jgi:hypothetical protein
MSVIVSLMLSLNIKHLGPDKVITLRDDYSLKTLLVGNVGPKRGRQIGDADVDGGADVRLGR